MAQVVRLRNGPEVLTEAILVACRLEERGFRLIAEGSDLRVVSTRTQLGHSETDRDTLTNFDRETIKKLKWHLLAVASYEPPPCN